jgi:hypothetical protein
MSRGDFIEETTTSIAGTSGDGAVTLTQITGLPRFSTVFGTGTRLVDYVIEDTVALKFEKGYGSVASNVLTRTTVHETWNGTTYDDTAPTALQFGSSPTSGNIRVRMAPTGDTFAPIIPAIQTTIGSDTYKGYQFSGHCQCNSNPSSSGALGTTNEIYTPFECITRGQVDGFALEVKTAGTGGNGIKAALYECGTNGLPGPCITQFNAIALGSTGFKTDTTPGTWAVNAGPLRISPGWFFIGVMTNDSAVAIANYGGNSWPRQTPLQRADGYGWGTTVSKTAENTYATGMPTGTPTGTYTLNSGGSTLGGLLYWLKINN